VAREGDRRKHGCCLTMADAVLDPWEADLLRGAVAALRRRAALQAKRAQDGTVRADDGSSIRTGEAAIADRVSLTPAALANEFELELPPAAAPAARTA
jgi:hypothetical protein